MWWGVELRDVVEEWNILYSMVMLHFTLQMYDCL